MNSDEKEYRSYLVQARQKAFEDFDKTLIALSAGALGVSITFIKDLIGPQANWVGVLFLTWVSWALSLVAILVSFFVSQVSLDLAIKDVDDGNLQSRPGGRWAVVTKILNISGGGLFLFGLLLFIIFISQNLEVIKNVKAK